MRVSLRMTGRGVASNLAALMGGKKKMKRILGTVVAIAGVLALSSLASAAPITYDVSGQTRTYTVSSFATTACPSGLAGNCFTTSSLAGSSITLEYDANGDTYSGDVTITSGTLYFDNLTSIIGGTVNIHTLGSSSISGGLGTLTGDDIVWTQPAAFTTTGILECSGANCAALQLTPGVQYPIAVLNQLGNASGINPIVLGTWDLDAGLANILGSTLAVTNVSNVAPGPATGALTFGPVSLGRTVPEPGSAALVLLGLGALALRSRKA